MIDCLNEIDHFVTGSARFGTAISESDIDICILVSKRDVVYDRVKETRILGSCKGEIEESDYNNGFKFYEEDKQYNIIPLHPRDYVSWYWAAKLMEVLPNKKYKQRPELHGIHETFIGFIKMYFADEFIDYGNFLKYCQDVFIDLNPKIDNIPSIHHNDLC